MTLFVQISLLLFLGFGVSCSLINAIDPVSGNEPPASAADRKAQILADMRNLGVLRENFSEWYVSPSGSKEGKGTPDSPVNLETALSGGLAGVRPGDVVWIRGGTYMGSVTSTISGSERLPVHIRQLPNERAILDKGTNSRDRGALDVRGDNVWFWDLEIANSHPDRKRLDADGELNPLRGSGINIYAANTKYINLVVRDNGHGFGLWNEDGGTEIYGCIIFNNGNNKKEHGVYGHNKTESHSISNNIIFNNAGYGLHLYANSQKSSVSGFEVESNTIFNNGSLMLEDQAADQILVGGVKGVPSARIVLRSNFIFNELDSPTSKNRGIRLGYEDTSNKDVKLLDNYIVSKVPLRVLWWDSVEARGNTIYAAGKNVEFVEPIPAGSGKYSWDANVYLSGPKREPEFSFNQGKIGFASWRGDRGFDRESKMIPDGENAIFVTPNKYDTSRATVTVYNWSKSGTLAVDVRKFLNKEDRYEVRDVQDLFGVPVAGGVHDGGLLVLKMNSTAVTKPIGGVEQVPPHTRSEFGVFLITKKGR